MSIQFNNSIVANMLAQPRPRGVLPSQSYPPNVGGSDPVRTPYLVVAPMALMHEDLGPAVIMDVGGFEGGVFYVGELEGGASYSPLQEPMFIKIENPLTRMSEAVVSEIDALMAEKEDETKPTEFAYSNARTVIESGYGRTRGQAKAPWTVREVIPNPVATTDDMGGIRLLWHEGTKQIRLNFGADQNRKSYLYFEEDAPGQVINHGVEPLDADHLAERLAWLMVK